MMACGNNSVRRDALQSSPRALAHPGQGPGAARSSISARQREAAHVRQIVGAAKADVTSAQSRLKSAASAADVDRAVGDARAAMGRARRTGDRTEILKLERDMSDLLAEAKAKIGEIETRDAVAFMARMSRQILLDRLSPQNLGMPPRPQVGDSNRQPPVNSTNAGLSTQDFAKVKSDIKRYEDLIVLCSTAEEVDSVLADAERVGDDASQHLSSNQAHSMRDRLTNLRKVATSQRSAAELLGDSSPMHVDYAAMGPVDSREAEEAFTERLLDEWASAYVDGGVAGDLVTFKDGDLVYLFDATGAQTETGSAARLVGVIGRTSTNALPRDAARIRHQQFAAADANEKIDRGHAIAHQLGGSDEGFNLFGQLAEVNRKGLWRQLEHDLSQRPGSLVFVRPVYTDETDRPSAVEHGHIADHGEPFVAYFSNRTQV